MGRGQSEAIESNLLLGAELHEALRPRSEQRVAAAQGKAQNKVQCMHEFDHVAPGRLVKLKDWLIQKLPRQEVDRWTDNALQVIPANANYEGIADRLATLRLKEECLPLAGNWPEESRDELIEAIQDVIATLESNGARAIAQRRVEAAKSATLSAVPTRSIATAGTEAALWSATAAFEVLRSPAEFEKDSGSAKWACKAVEWSARSDGLPLRQAERVSIAAIGREANRFVEELEKLPKA